MKRAVIIVLIVAAIGVGAGAYYMSRNGAAMTVNTAPITRGEIVDTVGATGTLQAVTTVQVGSQVSGNISYLGADFNSIVHKGQVIARLDPSLFQAQVAQARANLAKSKADVERNRVALLDAQQKYTRAKELAARKLIPQSDLDAAKIAVDSAQATLQSSQASVEQAQASLSQNQVSLEHCVITAPIDGIVTSRNVDIGQTVAASFQSPTLFIIAADLTKMQVNASIDEADVGRIRPGQQVTFRVDAYPTEDFHGTVSQIRLQPVVVQNVTTYGAVIDVPNTDLKLKPGMTANVKVEVARRTDALRIPNAALRFRPTAEMFAALGQAVPPELTARGTGSRGSQGSQGSQGSMGTRGAQAGQGAAGGEWQGRGADSADRQARMLERFKTLSADEQQQFLERLKSRGVDVSAFEQASKPAPKTAPKTAPKKGAAGQGAETIDALFAPLQPTESSGRAWLYMNKQLKPVHVRLGITDGQVTELLGSELQPGMEVVTSIFGGATRTNVTGTGNPLMGPQRGRPGGR
ncbi:MAG: efflux RND transporter periplasmic adaptor subunit [Betaproteobacteria bacterium]